MRTKSDSTFEMDQILPSKGRQTIFEKIREQWQFVNGFFPVPKYEMSCPDCDGEDFYLRHLGAGRKEGTPNPYRLEPEYVCVDCCQRFIKSLTVPEDVYEAFREEAGGHPKFSQSELQDYMEQIT